MGDTDLKLALLGTGRIADKQLAPAIVQAKGVQLWSVLSREAERADGFASRYGAASSTPAYTDPGELLRDPELDGVVIATPDKLHAGQAIAAARAGKHVLVEKPMATSVAEAEEMGRECDEAGVRLGVAYHLRWHAGHRLIANGVRNGEFGDLRHMRVQWTWPAPDDTNWRAHPDVGRWWSLAGVGTHCVDLVRWLMVPSCGEIDTVRSVISRSVWQGPHDETAVVALRLESGATAEWCSSVVFDSPTSLEIYGSRGYALCTDTLGSHGAGEIRTSLGELRYLPANPYIGEIEDFAAAIRDGRQPEVDGREGLRNVELLCLVEGA